MRITTATVVGIPSKTTWSTTAVIRLSLGDVFCACGFTGDETAPHEGRRLIRELESLQANDLREVYDFLQGLVSQLSSRVAASIAVAVVQDEQIMIMTFGYAQAGLVRPGQAARWLVDGQQRQQVLQGKIELKDQFVLTTARGQELKLLSLQPLPTVPDEWSGALFASVQTHSHSGEVAVCVLYASPEKGEEPTKGISLEEAVRGVTGAAEEFTDDPDDELDAQVITSKDDSPEPDSAPPQTALFLSPGRTHLISPDKLAQGIVAAQDVVEPRSARERASQWSQTPLKFAGKLRNWQQHTQTLRIGRILAVIVLFGVIIASIVAYRAWNVRQEHEQVIVPLQELVTQVQSYDQSRRFQQRAAAESLLERLNATRVSFASNRRQVQQMIGQVESVYNQVSGETNLVNLPVFYDFRLVASDFLATRTAFSEGLAVFLDANGKRIISLRLETKQNEILPVAIEDTLRDITISDREVSVLGDSGLWEANVSGGDWTRVREWGDSVSAPQSLGRFGDARYVLDRGDQQIWRVAADEDGNVASPSAWVRSARGIDFTEVDSISINGSIWLGSQSGDVYKLSRGERETWNIVGLPEAFTSTVLVASSLEGTRLAIVEPAQKRVVIVDKDSGEYLQQITSEQIGAVTDVFWNDTETALYLLSGSVVYKIDVNARE